MLSSRAKEKGKKTLVTKERKTKWSEQTYTRTLELRFLKWGKRPSIDQREIKYRGDNWDTVTNPETGEPFHFETRDRTPEDGAVGSS